MMAKPSANLLSCALIASLALASCGGDGGAGPESGTREIYASFPPLAQFASRIVGKELSVLCPVSESADPHEWEPSADEITLFQSAGLILLHGAELEAWTAKASLPVARTVDCSAGLKDSFVEIVHPGHSHGAEGPGTHTHVDPHVWFDPTLAKRQAKAIHDAVVAKWPEVADKAKLGYEALAADFDALDKRWSALRERLAAAKHYSAAEAFAYLAKRYGFSFREHLHVAPRGALSKEALDHLAEHVKDEGPKILWWETEPSAEIRQALEERFAFKHVVVRSGESAGIVTGADFFEIHGKNLDRLAAALGGGG